MDVKSTDWTRLRPKKLIDRTKEVKEIEEAFESGSKVVYLLGKGGIGKTRILEEVCRNHSDNFVTLGIFDVYHPDYHRVIGVERAIVRGVRERIDGDAFENYDKVRKDYLDAREKGMSSISLEELREKVGKTFWRDFEKVIEELGGRHLMLCFDTMELLFHERDEVEALLGERPRGLELADWLKEAMEKDFPNLHFLLSGRPDRDWWKTLSETRKGKEINLEPLDKKGVAEYLNSIGLGKEDPEMVYGWTHGEPLRLVFVTILRASGVNLPEPPVSDGEIDEEIAKQIAEKIDKELISRVMNLTDDTSLALPYIAFLSKGVTPEILSRAMSEAYGDEWNEEKAEKFLAWFRNMPFVKIRPSDERIFLHDEMYRVMRQYVLKGMKAELAEAAEKVVEYYREHEDLPRSEMVYYLLYGSWKEGFGEYRKLSDEAIAEHRTDDDLLLRDDLLRFVYDYGYNNLMPQITKDAAIRWPKRLLAMGEYGKAKDLTENIRKSELFGSLTPEEQHIFSVYEAEAKIYLGEIEAGLEMLEKAEEALKPKERTETVAYEGRQKVQAYIRALNDIGYARARRFDYWEAVNSYGKALEGYESLVSDQYRENGTKDWWYKVADIEKNYGQSILNDWADTLKNLSFAYSKLGFARAPLLIVNQSERLYNYTQNRYGLGLAMSTQGAIYAEREMFCDARSVLNVALYVFESEMPDERGRALALLSLGQALRKLVDMENLHGREDEFRKLLEESETHLKEARLRFEEKEPSRLPEVYQALGCLYRDRLAFAMRTNECDAHREVCDDYKRRSRESFQRALDTAVSALQKAEIYIDQAELEYHCCYKPGYGVPVDPEARKALESLLCKAEGLVPKQFLYPYRPPYPPEELKNTLWWKVMGKIHLLKGHVAFKAGDFEEAIEEYLESFLFFDLYSEEAALFSVVSRSGRRLYSKFSRIPESELIKMENVLLEKGPKRHILDRQGWRSLLSLVQDARLRAKPYVL